MLSALPLLAFVAAAEPKVVFEEQSAFATVYVVDEGPLRYLRFDSPRGDDQSVIDLRDKARVPMDYIRVAAAALAFDDGEGRALAIGLGGGTFPMLLRRAKPAYAIDAVEIDPVVVAVAKDFFAVVPDGKLALIVDDGARFVTNTNQRYDLAFVDAYSSDGVPPHLATSAFFRSVRERLAEAGVAVINVAVDEASTERRLRRAFHAAFPSCARLIGASPANVVLIGRAAPLGNADVRAALRAFDATKRLPFTLDAEVKTVSGCD